MTKEQAAALFADIRKRQQGLMNEAAAVSIASGEVFQHFGEGGNNYHFPTKEAFQKYWGLTDSDEWGSRFQFPDWISSNEMD